MASRSRSNGLGPTWISVAIGARGRAAPVGGSRRRHRSVVAAGAGDLLLDDHAGGRVGRGRAGVADVDPHRRRGRPVVPAAAAAAARRSGCSRSRFSASTINGRILAYYLVVLVALAIFLVLLRIVNSPFGRVLQAIRENEFRAEALGYRVVAYRTAASVISALAATVAGALLALWLRYNGPDTTLSFSIMIDILLMVVIGGMGTLYGAVIGADPVRAGAELSAGADGSRQQRHCPEFRSCRISSIPTAGCFGSVPCSSSASTHFRAASWDTCESADRNRSRRTKDPSQSFSLWGMEECAMSRAFVREAEGGEAFEDLPDRQISRHSNLVTSAGLAHIDEEIAALRKRLEEAQAQDDRAEVSRVSRELRYWTHRRATAEVVPDPIDHTM